MIPIAILASGRGTNFVAIHKAIRARQLDAEIVQVISNKPGAQVMERAKELGIPATVVPFASDKRIHVASQRRIHEESILKALGSKPRFLVLAGYMRILGPTLIEAFRSDQGYSRIVNVHPSLLPAFPGRDSYGQAFRFGAKVAGVTVHLVDEEIDHGGVCAQESFGITDCATADEVERRGLAVEHRLYPETLKWVLPEKFKVEKRLEGRVCVRPC